jgi:hypothetical protein
MSTFAFLSGCISEHDMVPPERVSKTIAEKYLRVAIVPRVLKITQWWHVQLMNLSICTGFQVPSFQKTKNQWKLGNYQNDR